MRIKFENEQNVSRQTAAKNIFLGDNNIREKIKKINSLP